jgi:hypothetical protein
MVLVYFLQTTIEEKQKTSSNTRKETTENYYAMKWTGSLFACMDIV